MSDRTIGPRVDPGEEGATSFMRAPMVKQQFPDFDDTPGPVVPPEAAPAATSASVAAAAAPAPAAAAAVAPAPVQAADDGGESSSDEPAPTENARRAKVVPAAGAGQKRASGDARNRGSEVKRQSNSSERYTRYMGVRVCLRER